MCMKSYDILNFYIWTTIINKCFSSLCTDHPESGNWKVCSQSEVNVAVGSDIYLRTAVGYSMCTDGKSTPTITKPPAACEIIT